jgi:hypothetical protein
LGSAEASGPVGLPVHALEAYFGRIMRPVRLGGGEVMA